jgi:hypothetical protein
VTRIVEDADEGHVLSRGATNFTMPRGIARVTMLSTGFTATPSCGGLRNTGLQLRRGYWIGLYARKAVV